MAVWRFYPYRDMFDRWSKLTREMDRLMSNDPAPGLASWSGVYPPVNFYEDDDHYYLTAELPGVDPADLDISVVGETLTLGGQRKIEVGDQVSFHRRERTEGRFRRVITLPGLVKADQIEATAQNGLLNITLPKADEIKPRQIKVSHG